MTSVVKMSMIVVVAAMFVACTERNPVYIEPVLDPAEPTPDPAEMVLVGPEAGVMNPIPPPIPECHAPYGTYYMSIDLATETGCSGIWSTHSGVQRTFDRWDPEITTCGWHDKHLRQEDPNSGCVQTESSHIYTDKKGWHGFLYAEITCPPGVISWNGIELPEWCKAMYTITATRKIYPWEEQQ